VGGYSIKTYERSSRKESDPQNILKDENNLPDDWIGGSGGYKVNGARRKDVINEDGK